MADAVSGIKRKRSTRKEINYAALGETTEAEIEFERDQKTDSAAISDEDTDEDDDLLEGDTVYGARKVPKAVEQQRRAKKRAKVTVTKEKSAEKPVKAFPFLSLPAELRDEIYELALVEPNGLTVVSKMKAHRRTIGRGAICIGGRYYKRRGYRFHRTTSSGGDMFKTNPRSADLIPNLLAVNKQIHAEAIGYLYKQPIILEHTLALHTFIASIGPKNRLQLSDLIVRSWGSGHGVHKAMNFAALTILSGCTNLKLLQLNCATAWHRTPVQLARQVYRDGHYWLEAFGSAKGKRDAALDVLQLEDANYKGLYPNRSSWRSSTAPVDIEEAKTAFDSELRRLLGCKVPKKNQPSLERVHGTDDRS